MIAHATIKLKVPTSKSLLVTMHEFSKATQFAYDYTRANKIKSWKLLHQQTYVDIRKFSKLGSQLCCKAIKVALETKKSCRNRKADFSTELSIQYDQRSYSFDFSGKCSLSTINGRFRTTLYIPEYYLRMYKDWKITSATLSKHGKDFFLNVTVEKEIDSSVHTSENQIIGIDLGINNLATTSEGQFFKGVRTHIAKLQRLRSKLQSKGTKSAKKHLKKLSGRQKRFMRSLNHEISKSIISKTNVGDIIVMEDLQGIKNIRKGRNMNRLLSNWSFFQLRQFIEYKACRNNVAVVTVSPAYTSKMCSRCHEIHSIRPENAGFFKCLNCGYSCNADLNASFNLRGRVNAVRNTFGLFVNQPIVAESSSDKPMALAIGS